MSALLLERLGQWGGGRGQPPREGKQCSALCQHLGEADGGLAVHRLPPLLPSPGGVWARLQGGRGVVQEIQKIQGEELCTGRPDLGRGCGNRGDRPGDWAEEPGNPLSHGPQSKAFPNHPELPFSRL